MTDVLDGSIPLVYAAIAGAIQHVKAGKLNGVLAPRRPHPHAQTACCPTIQQRLGHVSR